MKDKIGKTSSDEEEVPRLELKCGYKASSGRPCRNSAGMGTIHVGIGYCFWHDKSEDQPVAGRHLPLLQMLDPDLRSLVVRMISDDALLFDLRFELATMKAKYALTYGFSKLDDLVRMVRAITYTASTLREMEVGRHYYVHVNVLALVLEAVGRAAGQYLQTDDAKASFAKDLQSVMKRLLPRSTTQGMVTSALVDPITQGVETERLPDLGEDEPVEYEDEPEDQTDFLKPDATTLGSLGHQSNPDRQTG